MRVHTENSGSASSVPLIMVHGAGGSSSTWFMQLRGLRKSSHVICVDLNGHGQTTDRSEPDVTGSYLDDIREVVEQYERPFLAGHSMGGALVQLYALERPADVRGLILAGTGARLKVSPVIFGLLDNDFESYVAASASYMFSDSADNTVVEASQAEIRKCSVSVIRRDFQACDLFDIMQRVQEISVPTFIIVGGKDQMTPVKYSQYLADRISGSELVVVKDAGHMVMMEKHKEFNAAVMAWIARN